MTNSRSSEKTAPFYTVALLSIGVALLCGLIVRARHTSLDAATLDSQHLAHLFGLIHFGVGYYFYFAAARPRYADSGSHFRQRFALASAFFCGVVVLIAGTQIMNVARVLFYVHAVENALYMLYREIDQREQGRVSPGALVPLGALLYGIRLLDANPQQEAWVFWLRTGIVLAAFLVLASAARVVRVAEVSKVFAHGWPLLILFGLAVLIPEDHLGFNLFIIWHVTTWFIYIWIGRPRFRTQMLRVHAWMIGLYAPLMLFYVKDVWVDPLEFVVGPRGFLAQVAAHITFFFVARTYAARAGRSLLTVEG